MSTPALDAKNKGAQAWSQGDYEGAIVYFTGAINIGGDKEFLKVLYSNRSAAYLKIKKTHEALNDANKAIDLDNEYVKAYSRKGDALLAQNKITEAYNAYNRGLQYSPNDKIMIEKSEQAMRKIRSSTANTASNTNSSSKGGLMQYIKYIKMGVLVNSFIYFIPFLGSYGFMCFKVAAVMYLIENILIIYTNQGFPKFNSEYARKAISDPSFMRLFLSAFLLTSRPYLLALLPLVLNELTYFTPNIFKYIQANLPKVQGQVKSMIDRFIPSLRNVDLSLLFSQNQVNHANYLLLQASASCEVSQGIFLIIELILPSRNFIQLFLWWQYLQLRYISDSSGHVKSAFKTIDQRILSLLALPFCPQIIRKGYDVIKSYLQKQVEMKSSNSASNGSSSIGSLFSKCNIM